jgi:hypothetical protein
MAAPRLPIAAVVCFATYACGLALSGTAGEEAPSSDAASGESADRAETGNDSEGGSASDGESPPPPLTDAATDSLADAGGCASGAVCDVIGSATVLDVAVTSTALFWLDSAGEVRTAATDGSGARAIVTGEAAPLAGIEADAQFVYWTSNGRLRRAGASDGAAPTTLANVQGGCLKWMVPGALLAAAPTAGNIYSVNVSSGAMTLVTTGASDPWGVAALASDDFFYTNYDLGRIRRGDGGTTDPNLTVVTGQSGPRCMATDGSSLWWANQTSNTLVKSTTAGQNVQQLVTGQTSIAGVALDATTVYWSWQGGIRKRSK